MPSDANMSTTGLATVSNQVSLHQLLCQQEHAIGACEKVAESSFEEQLSEKCKVRKERRRGRKGSYGSLLRQKMDIQACRRERFCSNSSDRSARSPTSSSLAIWRGGPSLQAQPAHAVSCRRDGLEGEVYDSEHCRRCWSM